MVRCPFIEFAGKGEVGLVLVVLDVEQVSVNGSGGWRCLGVVVYGVEDGAWGVVEGVVD